MEVTSHLRMHSADLQRCCLGRGQLGAFHPVVQGGLQAVFASRGRLCRLLGQRFGGGHHLCQGVGGHHRGWVDVGAAGYADLQKHTSREL